MSMYVPKKSGPSEHLNELIWLFERSNGEPVPEVIEPGPTAFFHWPTESLDCGNKAYVMFMAYGLETVADIVRAFPELPKGDARVETETFLVRHSAPLPPSVSDDQAKALDHAFGGCGFGFDVLGMLCRTDRAMRGDPGAGVGPGVPRVKDAPLRLPLLNGLIERGCILVRDAARVSKDELVAIRDVGDKSVQKLREYEIACAEAWEASLSVAAEGAQRAWELMVLRHHWPLDATAYDACMPLAAVEEIGPGRTPKEYAIAIIDMVGAMPELHYALFATLMAKVNEERVGYRDSTYPRVVPVPRGAGWDYVAGRLPELPHLAYDEKARELKVYYRRLMEWLAEEINDEHERSIIERALAGVPFKEIAYLYVPGYETIKDFLREVLGGTPALVEDRFAHFYDTYQVNHQEFLDLTGEPVSTLEYLRWTYRGFHDEKKPLVLAVDDPDVPEEVREAIRVYLAESHFELDGVLMERSQYAIVLYLLQQHAAEKLMPLGELRKLYDQVIDLAGDPDGSLALPSDDKKLRDRLNKFMGVMALPKAAERRYGGSVRLYDPDEHDLATLESLISLFSPCGVTRCSAHEVFADERLAVAMEAAGVKNGYELHYVLFKYCKPMPCVKRRRTPMLDYGWPVE